MTSKLKRRVGDDGKRLKVTEDKTTNFIFDYPIFCFKNLHNVYGLDRCTHQEKSALLDCLYQLSQLTWQQISTTQRHGLGFEKINQSAIKTEMPAHITKDITLYAFRFDGKKPFLGYRNNFIFHIIFIDRDFTLYQH